MRRADVMEPIVGLLLAAGDSRRFGGDKLLHPLPGGEAIAAASARRLAAAVDRAIVLVRPGQPALRGALAPLGVEIVEVADAGNGMGATLAAGVRAAPQAGGWLVALGDMPYLREETLGGVAAALRAGAAIAAPYHGGRRGHPVGFAKRWFDALAALSGDEGARNLLRTQGEAIVRLEMDDPGCLFDVDVPGDLEKPGDFVSCGASMVISSKGTAPNAGTKWR